MSRRPRAPSSQDVAARGDAALIEATRKFDRLELAAVAPARDARPRSTPRRRPAIARDAGCAEIRPRPHRDLSPPPAAEGRTLHRRARRRARLALERGRGGRALCSRRHRGLSVVGADERGAGEGRGRRAARDGGAVARTASSIRWCWPRRSSAASARSTASAARRRSPRSPMAPRPSRRSPRSSGPATPMSPPPSGWCSARSAST